MAVDRSLPAADLARLVARAAYSRVPVIDGDLDHVVGMIHSFDVLERPEAPAARLRRVSFAAPEAEVPRADAHHAAGAAAPRHRAGCRGPHAGTGDAG